MKKLLTITLIFLATSANADTAEELCKGERYQPTIVGGAIGLLPCAFTPIGCLAVPVMAGVGYALQKYNNDYEGCVDARRKDLETFK